MATRGVKSNVQQCIVSIDFQEYLLPLNKGLAVIDLLQHATKCEVNLREIGIKKTFWKEDQKPRLELEVIDASQVKTKPDDEF